MSAEPTIFVVDDDAAVGRALQSAGKLLGHPVRAFDSATQVMMFMTIDQVKFRKAVVPGDQLRIEVVPLRKGKIFKMKGEVFVDGTLVSQAEFMATIADRSKLQ